VVLARDPGAAREHVDGVDLRTDVRERHRHHPPGGTLKPLVRLQPVGRTLLPFGAKPVAGLRLELVTTTLNVAGST
jgi:hypothetical protein